MAEVEVLEIKNGPAQTPGQTKLRAGVNQNNLAGELDVLGSNNLLNVRLSSNPANLQQTSDRGFIGVYGAGGELDLRASMEVDASGKGWIITENLDVKGHARADTLSATIKNFRIPHPAKKGKEIWYASLEGPEAGAYVRGTATLVNGEAVIDFPEHFELIIDESSLTISTSPWSAESKGLAVVDRSSSGFKVKELMKGEGTYKFDWEAKAVRSGFEDFEVIREEKKPIQNPNKKDNSSNSVENK